MYSELDQLSLELDQVPLSDCIDIGLKIEQLNLFALKVRKYCGFTFVS